MGMKSNPKRYRKYIIYKILTYIFTANAIIMLSNTILTQMSANSSISDNLTDFYTTIITGLIAYVLEDFERTMKSDQSYKRYKIKQKKRRQTPLQNYADYVDQTGRF